MTTTVVYAGTEDGHIQSYDGVDDDGEGSPIDGSYSAARTGSGYNAGALTASTSGTTLRIGQACEIAAATKYGVWESFLSFDTSSIADTDTISASVINVTSSTDSSQTDFTINARLYDWGTTVTTADWVAGGSLSGYTLLAHYATASGFTADSAYDFVDDAMPANTSKTGSTRMLLCSSRTEGNNTPTGNEHVDIRAADVSGTTSDPKLTVTHAAAASGPSWTTPADAASISSTPALAFTIPSAAAAQHFQMQLDTANTFDTGNLRDLNSHTDQTGWEYWDGAAWQAIPAGGVSTSYIGNDARHTVQTALSTTTWYRRVRAGVA